MKERFKQLVKALGIGQNEFCRRAGMPNSTIATMDKGPRADKLRDLAFAFPNVNIRWLLTGEGEMFERSNTGFDEDWYRNQIELKDKQIAFLMEMCQKGATQNLSQSINL